MTGIHLFGEEIIAVVMATKTRGFCQIWIENLAASANRK